MLYISIQNAIQRYLTVKANFCLICNCVCIEGDKTLWLSLLKKLLLYTFSSIKKKKYKKKRWNDAKWLSYKLWHSLPEEEENILNEE